MSAPSRKRRERPKKTVDHESVKSSSSSSHSKSSSSSSGSSAKSSSSSSSTVLKFNGARDLREILLLSTLSGRPVKISEIRAADLSRPGLRDYEISLLRLFEKVTNGSRIVIDATGTQLSYKPGLISGGGHLTHSCHTSMAIGYYLEPLIFLAMFGKEPLHIELEGTTNDNSSLSVDTIRTVVLPLLESFGVDVGQAELKIVRRGAPPLGGGLVHVRLPYVRDALEAVQLTNVGLVKRIRGIAYSTKVSPQLGNRCIEAARALLKPLCQDIFIHADHYKGIEAGSAPGYGLTLIAETDTHVQLATERFQSPSSSSAAASSSSADGADRAVDGLTAEDLGSLVAKQLLVEVLRAGFVDSSTQWFALLLLVLTPRNASKITLGELTPFTVRFLRHIKSFFAVEFKFDVEEEPQQLITLSCVGAGFRNLNRKYS